MINFHNKDSYQVIGLMSGTSLDGLDIAHCRFWKEGEKWNYELLDCLTIEYSNEWKDKLSGVSKFSEEERSKLDLDFGLFTGQCVKNFISSKNLQIDMISSHGHTVFHQPEMGITQQIGNGAEIQKICQLPVVNDFRTPDVLLGGQGAPLVPIGDMLLFSKYDACLNLGGFSNISYQEENNRVAFDICPVNIPLNLLANKLGLEYDKNGKTARTGTVIEDLLNVLNSLPYYEKLPPKSLGREWFDEVFIKELNKFESEIKDILHTIVEHVVIQISEVLNSRSLKEVLVTGGGALNEFLIQRLQQLSQAKIVVPDIQLVNYKEALIFGFMGVLKVREEINCLSSVTGASRDSCSGTLYT